jgi:asparagine synthetase B (glutamine-hydrolysing)
VRAALRGEEPAGAARSWVARYRKEAPPDVERLTCEGGSLPALARAGDCTVVFAGVLFDADVPHAEVLAKQFQAHGPACLTGLRGQFALIVADRQEDTLLCARDHLGVHALFYVELEGEWLFSSDVDALVAQGGVSNEVDRVAVAGHLTRRWFDPERTFFRRVRRLPPGHALVVRPRQARIYRYWDPTAGDEEPMDPAEAVSRFEALLEQATRRIAPGKAGVFLSGGVDSSLAAAVATKVARDDGFEPPSAFSLVFPHPSCDEEAAQRHVAATLGLSHVVVRLDETVTNGLLEAALALYVTLSWPSPNLFRPGYDFLARMAREEGIAVVLSGGGGEMLHGRRTAARRFLRDTAFHIRFPPARAYVTAAYRARVERSLPAWLAPGIGLRRQVLLEIVEQARSKHARLNSPSLSLGREAAFIRSRRLGVSTLSPILDPDVVEFLIRVPRGLLNRRGQVKHLAYEVLRRQVPLLDRSSLSAVSTGLYRNEVIRREAPIAWRALGGARVLRELGVVAGLRFDEEAQHDLTGADAHTLDQVWRALNVEAWLRARL